MLSRTILIRLAFNCLGGFISGTTSSSTSLGLNRLRSRFNGQADHPRLLRLHINHVILRPSDEITDLGGDLDRWVLRSSLHHGPLWDVIIVLRGFRCQMIR